MALTQLVKWRCFVILTLSRYARDATFLKIDEDRLGAPFFKGWIDDSFTMSTNFDEFRR